jgi:hypothetical protein
MQDKLDVLGAGFENPDDAEPIYTNGSYVFKFPEIETYNNPVTGDTERRFKVDGKGNKIYKKFYNRDGTQTDTFSQSDMQTGRAYDVVDDYDFTEDVGKIQNNTKLRFNTTDNGVTSITNSYNKDERVKEALDAMIETHVDNRDQRINVLYKYAKGKLTQKNLSDKERANFERFLHPLQEKDYTDEDKQIVRDEWKKAIMGGLPTEYKESVNLPAKIANDKYNQEQNKYNYTITRNSWANDDQIADSISLDRDKTSFGFPVAKIPLYSVKAGNYFDQNGNPENQDLPAGSYIADMTLIKFNDKEAPAYTVQVLDAKSSRELKKETDNLWLRTDIDNNKKEEMQNEILSSYGNKYSQHVYMFSKATADNILKQQTQGANKGKGYNVDYAKTILRKSQPKKKKQTKPKVGELD